MKILKISPRLYLLIFILAFLRIFASCSSDDVKEEVDKAKTNKTPTIELITKISSTQIVLGPTVNIQTNITDEDGEITEATLRVDGVLVQKITSPPFSFSWNTESATEGEHLVVITAIDDYEATSTLESWVTLTTTFTCGKYFFDPRDGNIYKTVKIGDQCWMAENLKFKTSEGSWDYNNDPEKGSIYGKLYSVQAALSASPPGWHLPSDEEWKILEGNVDSQIPVGDKRWDEWSYRGIDAGTNLKSKSGWTENGNGTDLFGFNALPGGYRYGEQQYENLGFSAPYWSSTKAGAFVYWSRELFSVKSGVDRSFYSDWAFAVRSVKD